MTWCRTGCKWGAFGLLFATFFVGGAFFADRESPFVRYEGYVIPSNPKPGDKVDIHWDAELKRVCEGKITRKLKDSDGDEFELQSSEARYMERGRFESMSSIMIPRSATCGMNTYTSEARYVCNPTHKIWPLYTTKSISFNVACEDGHGPDDQR